MTTSIQTSRIQNSFGYRRYRRANGIWNVIINCEDGSYYEHEVEAATESEAHMKADTLAQGNYCDVIYVEVYRA